MRIDQAKGIPLALILEKIGYQPIENRAHEIVYQSPFSKRENDRLKILPHLNIWTDDGIDKRGDAISFVITYLKFKNQPHTPEDALQWISRAIGERPPIFCIPDEEAIQEETGKVILKKIGFTHRGLINYVERKGIPHKLANEHLKPVKVLQPGKQKSFLALALQDEDNGMEIYNPFYRAFTGERNIYLIRGSNLQCKGIHIFKDIFDFLAASAWNKGRLENDSLIIHSYSLMPMMIGYTTNSKYMYVYTWMPNDKTGIQATKSLDDFLKGESGLTHVPLNKTYAPFLNMSEYHRSKLSLIG